VVGGADKIAFLMNSDIWSANLDGSELQQLTTDGTSKISLQWVPAGDALTYISAKCVLMVRLNGGPPENVACFNSIDLLKSFDISPDGRLVAITLDNQMYIVPFDVPQLQQANTRTKLAEMADCKDFAPYTKNLITQVRWSTDASTIAAKLIANLGDGRRGDIVQLFRIDQCIPNPKAQDNFPPPRFDVKGYDKNPVIQNFSWDGSLLFALNSLVRNDGYGDLYIYNTELHKAYPQVNPVNNECCYRDPQWSPDGTHLLFAFQSVLGGASSTTQLYYIPYGSIGSGATYTPLPLPELTDPREKPFPVLRPAR
jgi:Tol biopolymer transport system component